MVTRLIIVKLVRGQKWYATQFEPDCLDQPANGVRPWDRLKFQKCPARFIEGSPEGGNEETPRLALPVSAGETFYVNWEQIRIAFKSWYNAGLQQGGFAGTRIAFEKDELLLAAKPDELIDVLFTADQMARVVAFQTESFGAQQHRTAVMRQANEPNAKNDKRKAATPSCQSLSQAKRPTVFLTVSERPLIAVNRPPIAPTMPVASKIVRSRPVL